METTKEEYKGYEIRPLTQGNVVGLFELNTGKELPDYLKGYYTSLTRAKEMIDAYERSVKPRLRKATSGTD